MVSEHGIANCNYCSESTLLLRDPNLMTEYWSWNCALIKRKQFHENCENKRYCTRSDFDFKNEFGN